MSRTIPLSRQYSHIEVVIPDRYVAPVEGRSATRFHLPAAGTDVPLSQCCTRKGEWRWVEQTDPRRLGLQACRGSFEPILLYLSRDPESPVELLHPEAARSDDHAATEDPDPADRPELRPAPDGGTTYPPELEEIPEIVLAVGATQTFHAPRPEKPELPRCRNRDSAKYRRTEHKNIRTHYDPCGICFRNNPKT